MNERSIVAALARANADRDPERLRLEHECTRPLMCLALAAPVLGIDRRRVRSEARRLLDVFSAALAGGKPRWIERRLATEAMRQLRQNAGQRQQ